MYIFYIPPTLTQTINSLRQYVFSKHGGRLINNRRWFSLYDYLSLFTQAVTGMGNISYSASDPLLTGIMACLQRAGMAALRVGLTFYRLDTPLLPKQIELLDSGSSVIPRSPVHALMCVRFVQAMPRIVGCC